MTAVQTGTIQTRIPARLDRLPWSKFHYRILYGLGTVWILDGLEVTMVGSVAARITQPGSGLNLSAGEIGLAGSIYVIGACLGALFFGHLTDRFGRKRLFMLTLSVYIVATVATAFSFAPWWFFAARFFTGSGIGGEYAAINSAIDELIPARVRGRVDLLINGTYWLGSAAGSALAILFLDKAIFPAFYGWRIAFAVGAILGFTILLVRRNVPESPRWLFIHGREEEAERIAGNIESDVEQDTGQPLDEVERSITVRQRRTIPFRMIAETAFKLYPRRAILGFLLFVGQAFIYNGITFNLGTLFGDFYGIPGSFVPVFVIIYAVGNFLGPVLLGRLFDTVGRKPMITGTYIGSALVTIPLALLFVTHSVGPWAFIMLVVATFFLASAGASAAYLTVSEIFPMETRAMAIAFFYAIGTAVGGISGPLLFGQFIGSGSRVLVVVAFFIGAAVMAIGGLAEFFLGVKAEQATLEDIAKPLTVQEAESEGTPQASGEQEAPSEAEGHRIEARGCREQAEHSRARAAEYRATALQARGDARDEDAGSDADRSADECLLAAERLDERATSHDLFAEASEATGERDAQAATEQARAAEYRAQALDERIAGLRAAGDGEAGRHAALAEAALERARAREQSASGLRCRAEAESADGADAELPQARAAMHETWTRMHEALADARRAAADGGDEAGRDAREEAWRQEQRGYAAEQRVIAAEHERSAREVRAERETAERAEQRRQEARERRDRLRRREERASARAERLRERERSGLRRLRPGPGELLSQARLGGLDVSTDGAQDALDAEIEIIGRALRENGPTDREDLAELVGARYWGPGRFRAALRIAVAEGAARQVSRRTYGAAGEDGGEG